MKSQDSNEVLAVQAFECFNSQDYKSAIQQFLQLRNLQKIKISEKDKNCSRILHNQYVCEYLLNKNNNQQQFVTKLEQLLEQNLQQKNEKDEQLLLKYNLCVLLYGFQKYQKIQAILQEYLDKKGPINDLIQLKIIILYMEVCLQNENLEKPIQFLNMLEEQKHYIMSVFSQFPCEEKKNEKKQNFFTSIFFASEINRHEEPVSLVNKFEFNLILSYFRIQIFSKLNEVEACKQVFVLIRVLNL